MKSKSAITVSTHVARDFLQNAAYFSTLPKVIWEYVSNSIDNAREGQPVNVVVEITGLMIRVADDAAGMSREGLQNFFRMHGENQQRKRGKMVRGRFGTGKCAAFGIASCLHIDTTQNGKRNIVELHRQDIESAKDGSPFPVNDLAVDEPTEQSDGTLIEIRDLAIKRPDIEGTIIYVERHLSRYRQKARVIINERECQFEEPPTSEQFQLTPPPDVAKTIGDVILTVKVSPIPLDEENNGIDIYSRGIWHETTLAGLKKKDMAQYLFGEIDVPRLEDEREWDIPPFDNTRNNTLNPQNALVVILLAWISQELEKIRQKLVEDERRRRQSEEAKKLEKEASLIADILNADFEKLQMDFEFARRISSRQGNVKPSNHRGSQTEMLPGDGNAPTNWQPSGNPHGEGGHQGEQVGLGDAPRQGPDLIPGAEPGEPKSVDQAAQRRKKGLFSIEYRYESAENKRSRYDRDTRTIVINLEHPQTAGALRASGQNTESRQFREISYEIAAVEYAVAIPYEKIAQEGDHYQATDALYDVLDTINRVTRRFAEILAISSQRDEQ
jgi:hypothetical protein